MSAQRSSLYPDFADAFYACLTANAVLYAITLAFCLSALLGKVLLNGAWLFRLKPTASGRLVVPNATLFYTCVSLLA